MEAARAAAGAGTATLLVICGVRGIGKTATAAHAPHLAAGLFRGGQALAPKTRPGLWPCWPRPTTSTSGFWSPMPDLVTPAGVDVTVLLPGSVGTPVIEALGLGGAALPIRPQLPCGRPSPDSSDTGLCTSRADADHDPAHATVPIGPDERPHAGSGRPQPGPATGGRRRVTTPHFGPGVTRFGATPATFVH
jgi:hypothetical protein